MDDLDLVKKRTSSNDIGMYRGGAKTLTPDLVRNRNGSVGSGLPKRKVSSELMKKQLEVFNEELEQSQLRIQHLEKEVDKLERKKKKYRVEKRELEDKLKEYRIQNENLEGEILEWKSKLADHSFDEGTLAKLKEELKEKSLNEERILSKNKELRKKMNFASLEMKELQEERADLVKTVQKQQEEIEKVPQVLEERSGRLVKENERLSRALEEVKSQLSVSEETNEQMRKLRREVDRKSQRLEMLTNHFEAAHEEKEEMKKKLQEINVGALQKKLRGLQEKSKDLKDMRFLMESSVEELSSFHQDFQEMPRQILARIDQWRLLSDASDENTKDKVKNYIKQKEQEIQQKDKQIREKDKQIRQKDKQIQKEQREKDKLREHLRKIEAEAKRKGHIQQQPAILVSQYEEDDDDGERSRRNGQDEYNFYHFFGGNVLYLFSLETDLVEEGYTSFCSFFKIFIFFFTLPFLVFPPFHVWLMNYLCYYVHVDGLRVRPNLRHLLLHPKVSTCALLTSLGFVPGVLYAFLHWLLICSLCIPGCKFAFFRKSDYTELV